MSLTTILSPSQPVLLGLTIALPVLLLASFFSRKIAANLNEKQETPSAAEVILYGFSAVSKLLVAPLAVYVLYTGGFWLFTNASADFCHTWSNRQSRSRAAFCSSTSSISCSGLRGCGVAQY